MFIKKSTTSPVPSQLVPNQLGLQRLLSKRFSNIINSFLTRTCRQSQQPQCNLEIKRKHRYNYQAAEKNSGHMTFLIFYSKRWKKTLGKPEKGARVVKLDLDVATNAADTSGHILAIIMMMMVVVMMMTMMIVMVVMEAVMTRLKSSWCSEQHVFVQLLFQSKPASISMEQVPFTPTVHWDALSQKAAKGTPFSIDAPYTTHPNGQCPNVGGVNAKGCSLIGPFPMKKWAY